MDIGSATIASLALTYLWKILEAGAKETLLRLLKKAFRKTYEIPRAQKRAYQQAIQRLRKTYPQWAQVLESIEISDEEIEKALQDPVGTQQIDPEFLAKTWLEFLKRSGQATEELLSSDTPLEIVAADFLMWLTEALYAQPELQDLFQPSILRQILRELQLIRDSTTGRRSSTPRTFHAYIQWTEALHAFTDTQGAAFEIASRARLPLEKVYLPLKALPDPTLQSDRPLEAELHRLEEDLRRRGLAEEEIRRYLEAYIERESRARKREQGSGISVIRVVREHDRVILLGEPGSGKTTFLRYLALQHARALQRRQDMAGPQGELGETRLPIYIRIADYIQTPNWMSQPLSTVLPQILRRYEFNIDGLEDLLHKYLTQGKALVLLDGLDEIPQVDQRMEVVQRIDNFVRKYAPLGNRFIITSRIVGYRFAPLSQEYDHFVLRELDDEQIRDFVRRWTYALEEIATPEEDPKVRGLRVEKEVQRLLRTIARNPGVRRLASNPLMLQILVLIHRSQAILPQKRVHLYKVAARTLIEHWNIVRGLDEKARLNPQQVEIALAFLAFWLHRERPAGLAAEAEVYRLLARALHQEAQGTENGSLPEVFPPGLKTKVTNFLRRVREQTGIFVERMPKHYGFIHLSFEEYFAARYLVRHLLSTRAGERQKAQRFLREHLHDPNWHEPILLALAYMDQEGLLAVDDLVRTVVLAQGEEAQALGFRPSLYEDLLGRDFLFALQCLADDISLPTLKKPLLTQLLQEWVYHKGRGRFRMYRRALARRLIALRGTEHADDLGRAFVEIARNNGNARIRRSVQEGLEHLGVTHLLRELRKGPKAPAPSSGHTVTPEEVLALARTASGVSALVRALKTTPEPRARQLIIQILGETGSRKALSLFIQALMKDASWQVRAAAAWALGQLGSSAAVSPLVQALKKDGDLRVRRAVVQALGKIGSPRGLQALLQVMEEEKDSGLRRDAAKALGDLGASQAVPTLIQALTQDDDPRVREAAAESLGRIGSRDALPVLRHALQDSDPGVRRATIWTLAQLGAQAAGPNLLQALQQDPNGLVRRAAALALGRLQVQEATPLLIHTLLHDMDVSVREAAAESLGRLGTAVAELIQVLHQDQDWRVRQAAALALGYSESASQVLPALIQTLLQDNNPTVRQTATESIGRLALHLDAQTRSQLAQRLAAELQAAPQAPYADDLHAALWLLVVGE